MPKHLRDDEKARKETQAAEHRATRAKVRALKGLEPLAEKPVKAGRKKKAGEDLDTYCSMPGLPTLKLPPLDPACPNVIVDFESGGCLEDLDGVLLALLLPHLFRPEDIVRVFGIALHILANNRIGTDCPTGSGTVTTPHSRAQQRPQRFG